MIVNKQTIELIKEFEGFRAKAYKDSGGVWTIGYGTTAAAGVGIEPSRGMLITEEKAYGYLMAAVDKFAKKIKPLITAPINANEFGAFVSLSYNIGPAAFGNSTALRRFNDGDKAGSAIALTWFNKDDGKTLKGLERRRAAERELFETPVAVDHVIEVYPRVSFITILINIIKGLFK